MGLEPLPASPWIKDFELKSTKCPVIDDGVDAIIRTIMDSSEPVAVIAIGPLTNIAQALTREPRIAGKARFVAMSGSVLQGYGDHSTPPAAEYNVVADTLAAQHVFRAPWIEMMIAPLDTCKQTVLRGNRSKRVLESNKPLVKGLIESYRIWAKRDDLIQSSILFDAVAVYLAFSTKFLTIQKLPLSVTMDGFTRIAPDGKLVDCALAWKSMDEFEELLVERIV